MNIKIEKSYKNKKWLEKKYLDEKLSMNMIGGICGVYRTTIRDWLNKFDIKRDKKYIHKDWLIDQYVNKQLTTKQIGEECGISQSTISRNLKKLNILTRSLSEAFLGCTRKRTEEHNRKIGESNKGRVVTEKTKRRISESLEGQIISKETREKISKALKGRILSEEIRQKRRGKNNFFYGKRYCGINNGNWKGGVTSLINLIRSSFKYRQWRDDVFTRDNWTCQNCGDNKGSNLNAHHIKSLTSILQYYEITTYKEALKCKGLWNINNGITFCEDCHKIIHKRRG